jgi:hypothetical protein
VTHERSKTLQDQRTGRWVNVPGVIDGRELSDGLAEQLYHEGKLLPLGRKDYKKLPTAEYMASKRSTQSQHGAPGIRPPGARR